VMSRGESHRKMCRDLRVYLPSLLLEKARVGFWVPINFAAAAWKDTPAESSGYPPAVALRMTNEPGRKMLPKPPHRSYEQFPGGSCLGCSLEHKGTGFSLPDGAGDILLVGETHLRLQAATSRPAPHQTFSSWHHPSVHSKLAWSPWSH